LIASALALTNTSEAKVYPDVDNIFVRGKETAYSYNNQPPPPLKTYVQGDCPPIMMAQGIGRGRVVASGVVTECRLKPASDNFVELVNAIFQWLSAGKNVAWYDGYPEGPIVPYCTSTMCEDLIEKKRAEGYTITPISGPITKEKLAPYDILVLPELQAGIAAEGGDPDLLPDNDVEAIKEFVEDWGRGLLIMCGSDFFGPSGNKGNFCRVMNKVLINLGFGYGGRLFGFQSDSVYDDFNNEGGANYRPIVDVITSHPIGAAYQAATGLNTIRAYGGCSLAEFGKSMATYIVPSYQVGMPGETITYRVRVFNTGIPTSGAENVDLTTNLAVSDNAGWGPTLDNYVITVPEGENQTVILSVTIPSGTPLSTEDKIVVTVTSPDPFTESFSCIACAGKRLEVTEDACVTDQYPDRNFGDDTSLRIGRYENYWQYAYLKFDNLAEIPSGASITEARLYLFCWSAYGPPFEILCTAVNNDNWGEPIIFWNNMPPLGPVLDNKIVSVGGESEPVPYYWNVTSFVQHEFAGDKVASFCVRPADNCPPSTNRRFESREWWDTRLRPFLRVIYTEVPPPPPGKGVVVAIMPASQSGDPGEVLNFSVTVRNTGENRDTFSLGATDTKGWDLTLENESITLDGGASRTIGLSIEIPDGAADGDSTTITVRAVGTGYENSASCVAHCVVGPPPTRWGVQVSISPESKSGKPGEELNLMVAVKNTGEATDTFTLTASDTENWSPTLTITSTTLLAGASRQNIRLSITIPSTAADGDSTTITVTATGTGYENSATCTATANAGGVSPLLYMGAAVVIVVIIATVLVIKPF